MPEPKSYVDHSTGKEISGLVYEPDEVARMDEAELLAAAKNSFYVHDSTVRTKEKAAEEGLTRYFDGKACKNNHLSDRYTRTGQCIQCFRETVKRRKAKNPELYRAARKRSQKRRAEKRKEERAGA